LYYKKGVEMKRIHSKKVLQTSTIICIALLMSPICIADFLPKDVLKENNKKDVSSFFNTQKTAGSEYWALLFAVGVYKNNPDQNRPSMLEAVDNLHDVLLDSPQWKIENIHKITGSEATGVRLIQELIWLIKNEDSDDMSLIYITTHGSPLRNFNGYPIDIPPKDEYDGADEILIMYDGFDKWYGFVWDDLLNFFISLLKSKGVCLIVDSCFSGGFNDNPLFKRTTSIEYSAESFTQDFTNELSSQNRIVLMSCEENEVSYGSDFSDLLIAGFAGLADIPPFGNGDGIRSAEEAFDLAEFWLEFIGQQHPTILDLYPGEFPVTT
jgi:hypothetical protein